MIKLSAITSVTYRLSPVLSSWVRVFIFPFRYIMLPLARYLAASPANPLYMTMLCHSVFLLLRLWLLSYAFDLSFKEPYFV